MKISALINTRNEAGNIAECLDSVAWADEVVVVDQASTDATREIARGKGARVVEMEWQPGGVVESVRNRSIEQCAHEWVLIVDADERVPEKLAKTLKAIANNSEDSAFGLPRRNYFLGVWLEHGFWPDSQVRFIRKGKVAWSDAVHELPRVDGKLNWLPANAEEALEHPGYGNDLAAFIDKLVRYSRLEGAKLAQGLRPPIWPYIVRRPLGEFYGRYITSQSWRYGMHGLVWSALLAMYQLLIAIHYWALQTKPGQTGSAEEAKALRGKVRWEGLRANSKWLRF